MLLQTGELARHAGVTVRTLHHYEKIGLLLPSARSDAGYRLYSQRDVQRLYAIQALTRMGLRLAEVREMLESGMLSLGRSSTDRWSCCASRLTRRNGSMRA